MTTKKRRGEGETLMPEAPDDLIAAYEEALAAFLDYLSYRPKDATKKQLQMLALQASMRLHTLGGQEALDQLFEEARGAVDTVIAQRENDAAEKAKK
jgi:hypothetical protein